MLGTNKRRRDSPDMLPGARSPKRRRGRATAAAAGEEDALMSLPVGVLDDILTRLSTRDAVRTSALSRTWRRRWQALPSLDFCFPLPGDSQAGASEVLGIVDGSLLRFPVRVRRFCARLDLTTCAGRIRNWLGVLSRRGVQKLDLSFGDSFPALPSSVFSCSQLTSLTLCGCSIPLLPPDFAAFPLLRILILKKVRLQDYGEEQIEEIIHTSPLLSYLELTHVLVGSGGTGSGAHVSKWVIQAPNLTHLIIRSESNDIWILKELTSLYYAHVSLPDNFVHPNFAKFLSGLVGVKELLVNVRDDVPSSAMMPEILLCTFHNLKSLELFMNFGKQPSIMLTLCLLRSAPNLEKLMIEIFDMGKHEFEANGEFLNALWTDGMCANLQVVQMSSITWRPNEMSFIELILSKARLLNTLSITHSEEIVMSNEDALNELVRYRKGSAEARILFKGKAEDD